MVRSVIDFREAFDFVQNHKVLQNLVEFATWSLFLEHFKSFSFVESMSQKLTVSRTLSKSISKTKWVQQRKRFGTLFSDTFFQSNQ